ncbi:class I SAM-dependent methyltransferase [Puniceicoccaceae bacterium K14]|nr:class I SAM-dependent methyltransferase [Puniceicoccaceae bacterium K14]
MEDAAKEIAGLKEQLSAALKRIQALEKTIKSDTTDKSEKFDSFYLAFENKYRGSEEEISQRLHFYRDIVVDRIKDHDAKILDLGCGRGEWLDLLSASEYKNLEGVDLNSRMVSLCLNKGYSTQNGDIFDYLKSTKENSYDVISGFHIIEHFPFQKLVILFEQALRTLKPGGIAIFETPNPRNLFVGACSFHFDPTHIKPVPSELSSFLAEHLGFEILGVKYSNTHPDIPKELIEAPSLPALWHDSLAIGLDYGLVIKKPSN